MNKNHAVAVTRQIREPNEWAISPGHYAKLIYLIDEEFNAKLQDRQILAGPFTFMYFVGGIITVTKVAKTTNFFSDK